MMINEQIRQPLNEVRPLPIRYTVDELEFMPEDNNRYELIDGEFTVAHSPHLDHQHLASNLNTEFGIYLKKNHIGIVVQTPGIIFSEEDAVIPDLIFATHETVRISVIADGKRFAGKLNAAPELVIEILSYDKKDIERDRVIKRELYGKYGVKEYWVVDGLFNTIEVYRLGTEGLERIKRFDLHESIETEILPNFSLKLTDIFRF
ncbi:MAG TPA: Uma2 family endonuclease [Pyrinomonadaceae bacterium]|nr:Uma2 family endonuclease [Pyrinomonadaceae bacterium]